MGHVMFDDYVGGKIVAFRRYTGANFISSALRELVREYTILSKCNNFDCFDIRDGRFPRLLMQIARE